MSDRNNSVSPAAKIETGIREQAALKLEPAAGVVVDHMCRAEARLSGEQRVPEANQVNKLFPSREHQALRLPCR